MRRTLTLAGVALALAAAGYEHKTHTERPEDFNLWAGERVDRLERGLDAAAVDASASPGTKEKVEKLKQRLDGVESKLNETGDSNTWDAWEKRKGIREDIMNIGLGYGSVRRRLDEGR
jgi:hypothetical protein